MEIEPFLFGDIPEGVVVYLVKQMDDFIFKAFPIAKVKRDEISVS